MSSSSHPVNTIAIVALTRRGSCLGHRLQSLLPGVDLYLPEKFARADSINEYTYSFPVKNIINNLFHRYRHMLLIMAVGAAVRILAPVIRSKQGDPGVVVLDEMGIFAVSLLSGHAGGGNTLARKVSSLLCAQAVVTTASEVSATLPADILGIEFGWKLDNSADVKNVASCIINGDRVGIYQGAGEKNWRDSYTPWPANIHIYRDTKSLFKSKCKAVIIISDRLITSQKALQDKFTLIYRPQSLVLGIGCNRNTKADDIEKAVSQLFKRKRLSMGSIRNIATIDIKRNEKGLLEFAKKYNLNIQYFNKNELSKATTVSYASPTAMRYTGTPNVCEAAAILSSGNSPVIIPKFNHNRMISIALARLDFDDATSQQKGRLFLVGLGPGAPEHMTYRAREAIRQSGIIVGYKAYIELIKDFINGKKVIANGMGQEVKRAKTAINLAAKGNIVSLLSSGDTGIYGMAGLVGEIICSHSQNPVPLEVIPGVPLLAAGAALLGSPISSDFACISLSDYLVPWEQVKLRLKLVAQGDFIIILYNPKSRKRQLQLAEAREIILQHRTPKTPAGIVTNAYRQKQEVLVTDLEHLLDHNINMSTTIFIGNSATLNLNGWMSTPRGYQTKYSLNKKTRAERTTI